MSDIKNRMKYLVQKLNEASDKYYNYDESIMTDKEYDAMYDELVELEKNSNIKLSSSPTGKVGYTVLEKFEKVTHSQKMLSLNKTKEVEELEKFLESSDGVLSWKIDGLTVALTYKDGVLVKAVTRGNGTVGEDITHNVKVFHNVPVNIDYMGELFIRGEAVITFENFEIINRELEEKGLEKYKNTRNLTSGTVRQLNNEITSKRKVELIVFSIVECEKEFEYKHEQLQWLMELGFEVVEHTLVNKDNISEAVKKYESNIKNLNYATDGLVVTYDSIPYSIKQGVTSKFPKDSIAFKWNDDTQVTKLIDVEWNTSRVGTINPIAVFETVELEGTSVNRASLHNLNIFNSLELGVGDLVEVYKANMIIPQILDNKTRSNTLKAPSHCPTCKAETKIMESNGIKTLYCTSNTCEAKILYGFIHFVSRDSMNIENLSIATLQKFIDMGYIKTFDDIYKLEQYKDDIINLEGFGEKSYNKLVESINKSKTVNIENFIYALGINNVGLSNAKLLVKAVNSNDIQKYIDVDYDTLTYIDGYGDVIAQSICEYMKNKKNVEIINNLVKYIVFNDIKESEETNITDKIFVITGSVEKFDNRKELQKFIESRGGKVSSAVSSKVNYLVNNDNMSTSAKNKKAKELGISIITEDELLKMIEE